MEPTNVQEITRISAAREVNEILKAHNANGGRPLVMVPTGWEVKDVEAHQPRPVIQTLGLVAARLPSFAMLVKRFKTEDSMIAFNADRGQFTCIIDFATGTRNSWMHKKITFSPGIDDKWQRMTSLVNTWRTQHELAEVINDAQDMFLSPGGAAFRDMMLRLEGKNTETFASAKRLDNGSIACSYKQEIDIQISKGDAGGVIELPQDITLATPYFRDTPDISVGCELRYRVKAGEVSFKIHKPTHDLVRTKDDQVAVIMAEVGKATDTPVFEFS